MRELQNAIAENCAIHEGAALLSRQGVVGPYVVFRAGRRPAEVPACGGKSPKTLDEYMRGAK